MYVYDLIIGIILVIAGKSIPLIRMKNKQNITRHMISSDVYKISNEIILF